MHTTSPDFSLSDHLYIVFDTSGQYFKLAQGRTPASRRQHLKHAWCNVAHSFVIQFPAKPLTSSMSEMAELMLQHMALHRVAHTEMGGRVYLAKAWADTYAAFLPRLQEAGCLPVAPLRTVVPLDMEQRLALEAAEVASRAEAAARYQAALRAERQRKQAEDAARRQKTWNDTVEWAMARGRALVLEDVQGEKGAYIANLFSQLDSLTGGWLERLASRDGEMLDTWIFNTHTLEFDRIVEQLSSYWVFSTMPTRNVDGDYPPAVRLCESMAAPKYPKPHPGHARRQVALACSNVAAEFMARLSPGIRGWDLPLISAHRQFDPAKSEKYGEKIKVKKPSRVDVPNPMIAVWSAARTEAPVAVHGALKMAGLWLRNVWPNSVRYCEASPFPADERAPLMLVRLVKKSDIQVGFHAINLRTGISQNYFFEKEVATARAVIWEDIGAVSGTTLIATSIADAIAISQHFKYPVIITPTFFALQAYVPADGVNDVGVYLPRNFSRDWGCGAADIAADCTERTVRVSCRVPPTDESDAQSPRTWAQFLSTVPENSLIEFDKVCFSAEDDQDSYLLENAASQSPVDGKQAG